MKTMINGMVVTVKKNNELFAEGYKYMVEGDWRTTSRIDPWSGMPEVEGNVYFFTDREEAEAYAETQTWVFNNNIHGTVKEVVRKETKEERKAREIAEKIAEIERLKERIERMRKEIEECCGHGDFRGTGEYTLRKITDRVKEKK